MEKTDRPHRAHASGRTEQASGPPSEPRSGPPSGPRTRRRRLGRYRTTAIAGAALAAFCLAPLIAGGSAAVASQTAFPGAASPAVSSASLASAPACGRVAGRQPAWVSCLLGRMSLAEKVSQLFMINVYGTSATDTAPASVAANQALYGAPTVQDVISRYHPGGIIYFTWSNGLTSPAQVVGLSNGVQQAALSQSVPSPMLISTDQEEGWIVRIGSPATVFPGNMAVGATGDSRYAFGNAAVTGAELRAMGINVDNAPVVDTNINPLNTSDGVRSYGDSPSRVSTLSSAAVAGFQGPGRVASVAKHFPGLGGTSTNPDTGVTVSDQTLAQFHAANFPSFRAAIRAGTDEIMVTHIVAPKVDASGVPSSLSRIFVTGLLRGQLGYQGVIVTDAMNAQALSAYSPGQAAVMAVQAGDDELLYAQQPGSGPAGEFVTAYNAVLAAVKDGQIPLSRIEASDRRLLGLRWRLGLAANPFTDPAAVSKVVGTPAHQALARQTADASITVVRNGSHLLPLRLGPGTSVLLTGYGATGLPALGADFAVRGLAPRVLPTGSCPSAAQIAQAVAAARPSRLVVVTTWNVWDTTPFTGCPSGYSPQASLVKALLGAGTPVVVASEGTPYDIAYFPGAPTYVATYDPQAVSLNALAAVLFGDVSPRGKLPVTITSPPPSATVMFPRGWGLRD